VSPTISIGPLAVPVALLVVLAAVTAGWWAGERIGVRRGVPTTWALYVLLAAALVAARLAFVVQYRSAYLDAPLSMLDIRDGGWRPLAGLFGAALAAALLAIWRKPLARPLLAAVAGAGAVWAAGTLSLVALAPSPPRLPGLTLPSLAGAPVALDRFEGKPIVVNLWATWCPPCRREMPVLQHAQQRYPDTQFVFLNQGEEPAAVGRFLAANHLTLANVLLDQGGRAGVQLGQRALPTTLFFDARGRLVDTRVGELSAATLAERLEKFTPSPTGPR
jgi:thiol-disulfide isomerase/thioredoxin